MKINKWLLLSPTATAGGGQGTAAAGGSDDNTGQGQGAGDTGEGASGGEGAGDDGSSLFDDGAQGQGNGDPNSGGDHNDDNGQGQSAATGGNTGGAAGSAATSGAGQGTGLTKDDITEILKSAGIGQSQNTGAGTGQGVQGGQAQPQLTQEEFNQRFNVYNPTPEILAGLRSDNAQVQAASFLAMRDGIVKQALTMAGYQLEQLREQHISPISNYVQQQEAQAARDRFFKGNSDLKKYEAIVDATSIKLQNAGQFNGKSVAAIHKMVADESRNVLKQAGINLTTTQATSNGQAGGQNTSTRTAATTGGAGGRRMSTLTGGGQQGGRQGGGSPSGPAGIEVFD